MFVPNNYLQRYKTCILFIAVRNENDVDISNVNFRTDKRLVKF